jgi:hypothetical protein
MGSVCSIPRWIPFWQPDVGRLPVGRDRNIDTDAHITMQPLV